MVCVLTGRFGGRGGGRKKVMSCIQFFPELTVRYHFTCCLAYSVHSSMESLESDYITNRDQGFLCHIGVPMSEEPGFPPKSPAPKSGVQSIIPTLLS